MRLLPWRRMRVILVSLVAGSSIIYIISLSRSNVAKSFHGGTKPMKLVSKQESREEKDKKSLPKNEIATNGPYEKGAAASPIQNPVELEYEEQLKKVARTRQLDKDGVTSVKPHEKPETDSTAGEQACKAPELTIDDPEVMKHFSETPKPLECHKVPDKNWVRVEDFKFIIEPELEKKHGRIDCQYKPFWRVSDDKTRQEEHKNFPNNSRITTDFFQTYCSAADGSIYRNAHATVIAQPETVTRLKQTKHPTDWAPLNVYILGFDSLSRLTFMRKLPKTYRYITDHLEAVVMQGYNIVGDGTPQAFIPILTGSTEPELPLTRKRYANAKYVNVYPWIWNEFRDVGYATLYGEDSARVGTFTYRLKGFKEQPTDHYFRTFFQVYENDEYKHHKSSCLGSEKLHVQYFRYGLDFMNAYGKDIPKFSLLHYSALTHDNLNSPALIDDDVLEHLQTLERQGHLNQTLLMLMSDHGHRFAALRATQQGQQEERLPLFSFVAPKWFRTGMGRQQWKNLQQNIHRLTTPFDIHATLKELLHWQPDLEPSDSTDQYEGKLNRSLSLWHPVPKSRDCEQADIEPHWCTCLSWSDMPVTDVLVLRLAAAVVQTINDATLKERDFCSPLALDKIIDARRLQPREEVLKYKQASDYDGFVADLSNNATLQTATYQLHIRTSPGGALYEATLDHDNRVQTITVDLNVVSHINKFGDLPHCIIDRDYFLAKWCVCYDRIKSGEVTVAA